MSNKRTDVVGIGAVSWDRFLVVPWFPIPRDKIRAIRTEESAGGAVSTALVALRRWGLNCRYIGVLGYDEGSDRIVEDLVREEIVLDGLVRRSDAEAKCNTIIVDNRTGGRCVIQSPHRVSPLDTREIRPELFAGARVLHLDTSEEECALDVAKMAKSAGLTVTLEANSVTPKVRDLLRAADYVIAPRSFAEEFTHQDNPSRAAYALHLLAEKPVVITDGANGSYFQSAGPRVSSARVRSTGGG
ncbi:MAG: carbohydrate kinase family protein [Planctomycetota bacterium]